MDIRGVTAALILSDMLWRDSSMDNSGGGGGAAVPAQAAAGALEKMAESDYLRLDSLLLTCQLHVRGLLQARPRSSSDLKTYSTPGACQEQPCPACRYLPDGGLPAPPAALLTWAATHGRPAACVRALMLATEV